MPHRRQATKSIRQDKKRKKHNKEIKTEIRKTLKKLDAFIISKNIEEAKKWFKTAVSKLTKASKKGIIHKNTARRKASRLNKRLNKVNPHTPS